MIPCRLLILLLLFSCDPPRALPSTDLGEARTLTAQHMEAHVDTRVTVTGTPTPTRIVTHGDCRLYYLIDNRQLFVDDCTGSPTLPASFTGWLEPFDSLPDAPALSSYYRDHFDMEISRSTHVIHMDRPTPKP